MNGIYVFKILFLIILTILLYLLICWATTIRIHKGKFYIAKFTQNGSYWKIQSVSVRSAYELWTKNLLPRKKQNVHLSLGPASVTVYPKDNPIRTSPFFEANYPVCDAKSLANSNIGVVLGVPNIVKKIINEDRTFDFSFHIQNLDNPSTEVSISETKMLGYMERNSLYVAFYVEHEAQAKYMGEQ